MTNHLSVDSNFVSVMCNPFLVVIIYVFCEHLLRKSCTSVLVSIYLPVVTHICLLYSQLSCGYSYCSFKLWSVILRPLLYSLETGPDLIFSTTQTHSLIFYSKHQMHGYHCFSISVWVGGFKFPCFVIPFFYSATRPFALHSCLSIPVERS